MEGLSHLTAADHRIEIDGRTYRLSPLTLRDYGEIENRVIARRLDPVAVAVRNLEGLSPRQQEFLLGRAYDRAVAARQASAAEIDQWARTPDGLCTLFWMMVRKRQPRVTLARACELLEQLAGEARDELHRRMEACVGLPVGN